MGKAHELADLLAKVDFLKEWTRKIMISLGSNLGQKKNSNQFVHRILFLTSAIKQTVTQADGVHHFTVFLNKK